MPFYDYACENCGNLADIRHEMDENPEIKCSECGEVMYRKISSTFTVKMGHFKSRVEKKEEEHHKKVKDPERAVKMRKKAFGVDSVGNPSMKSDPKHVIKRGKTIGGQQMDIDKKDMVKALAKDPYSVQKAIDVVQKKGQKLDK